jgi:acyl-CoA reductase-like NAD-dependent aldehyde dehydrogenase
MEGNYVYPIVTEGISPNSHSFHEEFFGPVFNLYKASTPEECLSLANQSEYGLAGTIFSKDLNIAEMLANRL